MITPKELLQKAEKLFFKVVASKLKGEDIFPWTIPSNKQISGTNYSDWKNDIVPLHQQAKGSKEKGYTVEWKEKKINGSIQSIPAKIYFETFDDFLFFTRKETQYQKIESAKNLIVSDFPVLEQWVDENPATLLKYADSWNDLLKVCRYFATHEPPHQLYIRELPIEVHSKFIEQNTSIIKKLLDQILSESWINRDETDFVARYSLKRTSVYTHIRILDDALKPFLGYDGCSLTLEDTAWLKWLPEKVFIIENQACYLSFPKVKNSVAIFGEGFKSRLSKHIPWLEKTQILCWFDLDAAGFEMLNMMRQHYPNVQSFLMNKITFERFSEFTVENRNKKKELPFLSTEEMQLYQFLTENNQRLEQERITQQYIKEQLSEKVN